MRTYAYQQLTVGSTAIGFDRSIIRPNELTDPIRAFFIVEGNPIRVSSVVTPTETEGFLAPIGASVTITGQEAIKKFKAISKDASKTASIFVEFTEN